MGVAVLCQKHLAEAACALALAVSLLQKHLDITKKHMPARTTSVRSAAPVYALPAPKVLKVFTEVSLNI